MRVNYFSCLIVVSFFLITGCELKPQQNNLIGQNNAVWTESIYFRGINPASGAKLTDQYILDYIALLKDNQIKYIYVFAGPFGVDGHLPQYSFSQIARHSIDIFKKNYPELVVLPWIGGIQNKTVYLNDSVWVRNALTDTKKLIERLNVPGVHLDFEHLLPEYAYIDTGIHKSTPNEFAEYNENVNNFHQKLRAILPNAFISAVVTATSPGTNPWKAKTPYRYLTTLSHNVNQLDFLYYDTGINDENEFQENCNYLINDIAKLKKANQLKPVQMLIAIGTFQNPSSIFQHFRNLKVESISNTIEAIKKGLKQGKQPLQKIDGIALFCDWQTDKEEWKEFQNAWLGK